MKKKLLLISLVVICAALFVTGSLAYFTAEDTAHNVITTGGVNIDTVETQMDASGIEVPYPDEAIRVLPGYEVSKIVKVKNLIASCHVRAKIEVEFYDSDEKKMELSEEAIRNMVHLPYNEEAWEQKAVDDGWWYLKEPLAEGPVTSEALIEQVEFSGPNITNEYKDCTIHVIVYAQAVQSANNGASAVEAAGWPVP